MKLSKQRALTSYPQRDASGQVKTPKNPSEWEALAFCRGQMEGPVRTPKETEWARGTHKLPGTKERDESGH
jgi:hypothetical protein